MLVRAFAARARSQLLTTAAFLALSAAISPAVAQGKGNDKSRGLPPGQAKKHVTPTQAVVVSREVLVRHGFEIVRVETIRTEQVIYYRRGNNGRGRGRGPVQKMVVRPSGTVVVFEAAPEKVLLDIRVRLGL